MTTTTTNGSSHTDPVTREGQHTPTSSPDAAAVAIEAAPVPPHITPPSSSAYADLGKVLSYADSDNSEEPLFQHPSSPSSPSSTQLLGSGIGGFLTTSGNGGNGQPYAAVLVQEPLLGRDVSNRPSSSCSAFGSNSTVPTKWRAERASTGAAVRPVLYGSYANIVTPHITSGDSIFFGSMSGGFGPHRPLFRAATKTVAGRPSSPLSLPGRWGVRLQLDEASTSASQGRTAANMAPAAPSTPQTPANSVDPVLVAEPPTPAKQRRTIHTNAVPCAGLNFPSTPATCRPLGLSTPTTMIATTTVATGADRTSPAAFSPPNKPSRNSVPPRPPAATTPAINAAPSLSFKFHKREGSRKRSGEVLSQFSALDLDETPSTPYGQNLYSSRFSGIGNVGHNTAGYHQLQGYQTAHNSLAYNHNRSGSLGFPSQPSANGGPGGAVVPTSPLMTGYATPMTLSQQIGGQNSYSQLLLHPSQEVLDMSQADTECSNFLARRILNEYNEVRLLGRGSFGAVSLYKEICSGDYVAVKMSPPLRAPDMERRYRRERSIMGLVRGLPHVVQLSAAWEEGRVPRMYLQLEYCPGGSVAAVASAKQTRQEPWPEAEVKVFLAHMSIALDALHRVNVAHVDFKPDNVLVDRHGAYKLSDFGCSVLLDAQGRPRAETQNGYAVTALSPGRTPVCKPNPDAQENEDRTRVLGEPGMNRDGAVNFHWSEGNETSTTSVDEGDCRYLCADMLNEKRYFKAGDMFSLGMSLYELMSGQPLPRNGDAFLALRRQVPADSLLRRGYSQDLVRLVSALLRSDPQQRPTARQVLQYLRPSPEELRVLGDRAAVQSWTASTETFRVATERGDNDDAKNETGVTHSVAALRCLSALTEATAWLFTTMQHDVHRTITTVTAFNGDEESSGDFVGRGAAVGQQVQPRDTLQTTEDLADVELELVGLPMSPIARNVACTPTTLHF